MFPSSAPCCWPPRVLTPVSTFVSLFVPLRRFELDCLSTTVRLSPAVDFWAWLLSSKA